MQTACRQCAGTFTAEGARGRTPIYCSTRCRVAAHRKRHAQPFPPEMMGKRWTRADGKRPVTPAGTPASSTNPSTWSEFTDVQQGAGDGYGIMLGDGIGCYDLDNVVDADGSLLDAAAEVVAGIAEPIIFAERSVSGRGLHVFVKAVEAPGWRRPLVGGGAVERYTRARFIRVTGDRVEVSAHV